MGGFEFWGQPLPSDLGADCNRVLAQAAISCPPLSSLAELKEHRQFWLLLLGAFWIGVFVAPLLDAVYLARLQLIEWIARKVRKTAGPQTPDFEGGVATGGVGRVSKKVRIA